MTTSGEALASTAAASFWGNCEFSTTTYSTWVLLADPHCWIWSPSALSPSGVKDCQPQTVTLLPFDLVPDAPAAAGVAPAGAAGALVGAGTGAAGGHAAASSTAAPRPRYRRKSRPVAGAR